MIVDLDLEEVLEDLHAGLLVRPQLSVWVHRADLDRDQLASQLERAFSAEVRAFRAVRQVRLEATRAVEVAAARGEERQAGRASRWAAKGALAAGFAMILVTNPLLDLFLLALAASQGAEAVLETLREAKATAASEQAERDYSDGSEAVGRTVRAKKAAFRVALNHITVNVHPDLAAVASDYAALDDVPFDLGQAADPPWPDARSALGSARYRSALPGWYHPLLEGRLETWAEGS